MRRRRITITSPTPTGSSWQAAHSSSAKDCAIGAACRPKISVSVATTTSARARRNTDGNCS
jgi:hypothetical protein